MFFDIEYYISLWCALILGLLVLVDVFYKIKSPSLVTPIIVVYLLFYWLPLVCDVIIGIPEYQTKFYNLQIVASNSEVCTIYNLYVFFTLLVFLYFSRKKNLFVNKVEVCESILFLSRKHISKVVLFLICLSPILFLILTDKPSQLLTYRTLVPDFESPEGSMYMMMMSSTIVVALVAPLLIVAEELSVRKNYLIQIFILLLLMFAVFLNGKRYILAISIIIYGGLHYYTGFKSRRKLFLNSIICLGLFIAFLSFYGKNSRSSFTESYSSIRIDLGRDDVTKYSIYKAFYNKPDPILEYPGQSVLFTLLFFVPRILWTSKPYPYAVYFTANLLGYDSDVGYLGWSMTTSLFEELITNFSYIGFFVPLLYMFSLKWLNKKKLTIKFLGLFILIMSIVVQLSAMTGPILIFLFLVLFTKNNKLKCEYENNYYSR